MLVLFERPRNEVLRDLIQSPRQVEFRPELERADLVEEYPGHLVDYEIRMLLMTVRYRARHGWDFETGQVWWSLDPEAEVCAIGFPVYAITLFVTLLLMGRWPI